MLECILKRMPNLAGKITYRMGIMQPFSKVLPMMQRFKIYIQYLVPQHFLTLIAGIIAHCKWRWFKNFLIQDFIKRYHVDLHLAQLESIDDYPNFNAFFTRKLKPHLRPIAIHPKQIASPADGAVSQVGAIDKNLLFQAKGFYFKLGALLGGDEHLEKTFYNGNFVTIYLAPKDYHRVHMPMAGELRETIFIPGKLFSVNQATAAGVPELFSKNERLICVFETAFGPMCVILVGAMLVGSVKTVWPLDLKHKKITKKFYDNMVRLEKGAEIAHFKMGSTVLVLFPKDKMQWLPLLRANSEVVMGKAIGEFN
jgi:phosphatidylserine decarboxylase